jgi:hypothetical protein
MWSTRPRPDDTFLKLGLLAAFAVATVAAVFALAIGGVVDDDPFFDTAVPSVLMLVSVVDIFTTRFLVLPSQVTQATERLQSGDTAGFQQAAQAMGILAMVFIMAKGIYALVVTVMVGVVWLPLPFAAVALIEFAVFRSYISPSLDRLWRDKMLQVGA